MRAVPRRPMRRQFEVNRRLMSSTDPETGVASGLPEAAMCVQDIDVQCVLQFTLIHAAGCALHRHTSRVIHRLELYRFSVTTVYASRRRRPHPRRQGTIATFATVQPKSTVRIRQERRDVAQRGATDQKTDRFFEPRSHHVADARTTPATQHRSPRPTMLGRPNGTGTPRSTTHNRYSVFPRDDRSAGFHASAYGRPPYKYEEDCPFVTTM